MSDLKGKRRVRRGLLFPGSPVKVGVREMFGNDIPGPTS